MDAQLLRSLAPRAAIRFAAACALAAGAAPAARALDVQGTVQLQGLVVFAAPIAGVEADALTVEPDVITEATGNGVRCSVLATSADVATSGGPGSGTGSYPSAGSVSAELLMERGGPAPPQGACLLTLRARGVDASGLVTVHGSTTLLASAADLQAGAPLDAPDLVVRESKALAGLDAACKRWVKKHLKLRDKCNALILKYGGAVAAEKCKDADLEPPACDPGQHAEAVLALAHGGNDQQVDPPSGEGVDMATLGDQAKCQQLFGKASVKFVGKLLARIQAECVKPAEDSAACREAQAQAVRSSLDAIDSCAVDALADGATGRVVPRVGAPCNACIVAGAVDKKCLKGCFQSELAGLAGGVVGDAPVCGDGILQNGEFCDDGNLADGDGCSALCGVEAP